MDIVGIGNRCGSPEHNKLYVCKYHNNNGQNGECILIDLFRYDKITQRYYFVMNMVEYIEWEYILVAYEWSEVKDRIWDMTLGGGGSNRI